MRKKGLANGWSPELKTKRNLKFGGWISKLLGTDDSPRLPVGWESLSHAYILGPDNLICSFTGP